MSAGALRKGFGAGAPWVGVGEGVGVARVVRSDVRRLRGVGSVIFYPAAAFSSFSLIFSFLLCSLGIEGARGPGRRLLDGRECLKWKCDEIRGRDSRLDSTRKPVLFISPGQLVRKSSLVIPILFGMDAVYSGLDKMLLDVGSGKFTFFGEIRSHPTTYTTTTTT